MQLAVRPKELERGLMERRDLGTDDAMVFVFERPQPMSFWMRNTPTPLDIAYFSPEERWWNITPRILLTKNRCRRAASGCSLSSKPTKAGFAQMGSSPVRV